MHAILFGLKRAHQASLTVSRPLLRPFGLTPARFDMLCAIAQHRCLTQIELARVLGVRASTVSRMVKALLQLNLVEIAGTEDDLRVRCVYLSDHGEVLLEDALQSVVGSGAADLVGSVASSWSLSERRRRKHIGRLQRHLRWVRYAFGDNAIRFRKYQNDIDQLSLRRPCALLVRPPNLADQLWAAA